MSVQLLIKTLDRSNRVTSSCNYLGVFFFVCFFVKYTKGVYSKAVSLTRSVLDAQPTSSVAQYNVEDAQPSKSSGIDLASWNQKNLDSDTQDLFSDSPVKVFLKMH